MLEDKLQKLLPSVPKARIRAVKKEINKRIIHDDWVSKRTTYGDKDRAKVGDYVAIHGVTTTMRHFEDTKEFPNLKESTVCGWKDEYNVLRKRSPVVKLPTKRQGRPLLIGDTWRQK